MEKVKIGMKQLNNPTPKGLKTFFRWFSFVNGVAAIILAMLPQVPEHVKYNILTYGAIGNAVIHFGIKFFGLQNTGLESAPPSQYR